MSWAFRNTPWMASVALAAIGCDAQVTPDFKGQAPVLFQGQVTNALDYDEVRVAIAWISGDRASFQVVIDTLELNKDGPTPFSVALDHGPATNELADCTHGGLAPEENHLGFGWIVVAPKGVSLDEPVSVEKLMDMREHNSIVGFALNHVLVYVGESEAMGIGTNSSKILGGAYSPGAYLMETADPLTLAAMDRSVPISLSLSSEGAPYFPWLLCTNVEPPPEAIQQSSLVADVNRGATSTGRSR